MDKEILYIMGTGRSGTTLIDIILGNSKSCFSAGELNRFPKRDGIPPARKANSYAFDFWVAIRNEIVTNYDLSRITKLSELFEYHTGLLVLKIKARKKREYYRYLLDFFKLLQTRVESRVVVDSSKYPLRAYHLLKAGVNIKYCIYLKRHPIAVVSSFQKEGVEQPSKNWVIVNFYLIVVHLLSLGVCFYLRKKGVKVFTTSFEEATNNPVKFIDDLRESFDIDLNDLKVLLKNNELLNPNNLFDGNRIRLNKFIQIKKSSIPSKFTWNEQLVYYCNLFWWRSKRN